MTPLKPSSRGNNYLLSSTITRSNTTATRPSLTRQNEKYGSYRVNCEEKCKQKVTIKKATPTSSQAINNTPTLLTTALPETVCLINTVEKKRSHIVADQLKLLIFNTDSQRGKASLSRFSSMAQENSQSERTSRTIETSRGILRLRISYDLIPITKLQAHRIMSKFTGRRNGVEELQSISSRDQGERTASSTGGLIRLTCHTGAPRSVWQVGTS